MMQSTAASRAPANCSLRTTVYDNLIAFLNAAIVVLGIYVLILFVIWWNASLDAGLLDRRSTPPRLDGDKSDKPGDQTPKWIIPVPQANAVTDPGADELPEATTPQLTQLLESVTEAVSTVRGDRATRDGDSRMVGPGESPGARKPGGRTFCLVPESRRWQIEYEVSSLQEYQQLLQFFAIDLGVVDPDSNSIQRIRFSDQGVQVIPSDRAKESKTLYFVHRRRSMRRWDESLARMAGIPWDDQFVVQFYSPATQQYLRELEQNAVRAHHRTVDQVQRTLFRIQPVNDGFEIKVIQTDYRSMD